MIENILSVSDGGVVCAAEAHSYHDLKFNIIALDALSEPTRFGKSAWEKDQKESGVCRVTD